MAKWRVSNETLGYMVAGWFDSIDEAIAAVSRDYPGLTPLKVSTMDLTNCVQVDVDWPKPLGRRTFKIGQEGLVW